MCTALPLATASRLQLAESASRAALAPGSGSTAATTSLALRGGNSLCEQEKLRKAGEELRRV